VRLLGVKELPGSGAPDELIEAAGISSRGTFANAVRANDRRKRPGSSRRALARRFVDAESAWIRENDNRGGGDLRPDSFCPGSPPRGVRVNRLMLRGDARFEQAGVGSFNPVLFQILKWGASRTQTHRGRSCPMSSV